MSLKRYCRIGVILTSALLPSHGAFADTLIEAVPAAWRLQNYVNAASQVYYSGSTCTSGSLTFPPNTSPEEINRFWALVLTAKATGRAIGVFYETTSGACQITSFYQT